MLKRTTLPNKSTFVCSSNHYISEHTALKYLLGFCVSKFNFSLQFAYIAFQDLFGEKAYSNLHELEVTEQHCAQRSEVCDVNKGTLTWHMKWAKVKKKFLKKQQARSRAVQWWCSRPVTAFFSQFKEVCQRFLCLCGNTLRLSVMENWLCVQ